MQMKKNNSLNVISCVICVLAIAMLVFTVFFVKNGVIYLPWGSYGQTSYVSASGRDADRDDIDSVSKSNDEHEAGISRDVNAPAREQEPTSIANEPALTTEQTPAPVEFITIRGIEYSTDLTRLEIPNEGLTNIMELRLDNNPITDWSPVSHIESVSGRP